MTDYWKSNPRKFCEVCKCWFGDNKASVDFHERGRRHQENVKKLLSTARQRTAENEKEAAKTNEILASIEMAAAAAYLKDLEGGDQEETKTKKKKSRLPSATAITTPPPVVIEEPFEVRKAKAHMEILQAIQERQQKSEEEAVKRVLEAGPPPPPPSQWQQATTPEGHMYYYNIFTRETQWEEPEDYQPLPSPQLTPQHHPPSNTYTASSTTASNLKEEAGDEQFESGKKQSWEMTIEEEPPAAKRPTGPYGGWTTVAMHPWQPDSDEREEEKGGSDGGEVDSEEDGDGRKVEDEDEDRPSFGERTLVSLEENSREEEITPGSFRGFGFKKRSNTGRPKIRQRTSELS